MNKLIENESNNSFDFIDYMLEKAKRFNKHLSKSPRCKCCSTCKEKVSWNKNKKCWNKYAKNHKPKKERSPNWKGGYTKKELVRSLQEDLGVSRKEAINLLKKAGKTNVVKTKNEIKKLRSTK